MIPVKVKYKKLVDNPKYLMMRDENNPLTETEPRMIEVKCEGIMIAVTQALDDSNLSRASNKSPAGVIQLKNNTFEVVLLKNLLADQGE